jgi:CPA1 family monovalent cation:H+ antiporter
MRTIREIQINAMYAAVSELEEYAKTLEQPDYVYAVILTYKRMLKRFNRPENHNTEELEEQKEELRLSVLDAERTEIRRMYEAGEISVAQDKELRRFINYI